MNNCATDIHLVSHVSVKRGGLAILDGLITSDDLMNVGKPESLGAYQKAQDIRVAERKRLHEELRIRKGWDNPHFSNAEVEPSSDRVEP
jgi:hypothetical protein